MSCSSVKVRLGNLRDCQSSGNVPVRVGWNESSIVIPSHSQANVGFVQMALARHSDLLLSGMMTELKGPMPLLCLHLFCSQI